MLAMDDTGALLRFVQHSNDVDLREGEVALRARGRYSELVALYQQRGQHEAALDLLHTLTLSPQDLSIRPQGKLGMLTPAAHQAVEQLAIHSIISCPSSFLMVCKT